MPAGVLGGLPPNMIIPLCGSALLRCAVVPAFEAESVSEHDARARVFIACARHVPGTRVFGPRVRRLCAGQEISPPLLHVLFFLFIFVAVHNINCITNFIIMFTISIKSESGTSSVPVSRVSELEQAISFGFQLHQASTCKHLITVSDGTQTVASFMRVESFTLPAPVPAEDTEQKKTFGIRRK